MRGSRSRAHFTVGSGRHRIEVNGRRRRRRDSSRSWDPWEIERRGELDSGVEYRTPRGFAASEDARAVDLDFGDGVNFAPGPAHRFDLYDGTVIERDGRDIHLVPGRIFTKGFVLVLLATSRPAAVSVDGAPVSFEWTSERSGTLVIMAPPHESRVTIR